MSIPIDYAERVYAGVLGKLIGVYLGRPFEGWTYERIMAELGEVDHYVHERRGVPLVVTDDDISGTFTFLRALPDHGNTARPDAGADRRDLAQLHHRAAHDPLVGRHRQLDRAHRLPAPQERHPGAGERLDRAQRHRWSPSRSARRSSSTAGRWSRPATRSWPPTSPAAPPASATTARRSTARR